MCGRFYQWPAEGLFGKARIPIPPYDGEQLKVKIRIRRNKSRSGWLASLLGVAVLSGCASLSATKPEDAVSARALDYWNALIAGDWEKAYAHTSPGYRASVDLFGFRKQRDSFVKYKEASVASVNCDEAAACKVKMKLRIAIMNDQPTELTKFLDERWLNDGGQWYRFVER